MQETYEEVKKAVLKSQHCQRNWDLSREIDQADLDLIKHSLTNCPSKQNIAYYKVHMITDRNLIEEIHSYTDGFTINIEGSKSVTNSQCLANLLVVFEANDPFQNKQCIETHNLQMVCMEILKLKIQMCLKEINIWQLELRQDMLI